MPTEFATFIHPAKVYRLRYPVDWDHIQKDEGRSCGFGPRERDDVGLWITILGLSIDSEKVERDLPTIFQQAVNNEGENIRCDPTLRPLSLI